MATVHSTVQLKPAFPSVHLGDSLPLTVIVTPATSEPNYLVVWTLPRSSALILTPPDEIMLPSGGSPYIMTFHPGPGAPSGDAILNAYWETAGLRPGRSHITVRVFSTALPTLAQAVDEFHNTHGMGSKILVLQTPDPAETFVTVLRAALEPTTVTMRRAESPPTADQALWTAIRNSANALTFNNYARFMDIVMCGDDGDLGVGIGYAQHLRDRVKHRLRLPFPDTDAYRQLKVATEVFVMFNCGVFFDEQRRLELEMSRDMLAAESRRYYQHVEAETINDYWNQLLENVATEPGKPAAATIPYLAIIRRKLQDVPVVHPTHEGREGWLQTEESATACLGILMRKLTHPCLLELIWSYWHEEGMLVQTMNAITWRFQNRRGAGDRDPLTLLEIDPLRPLNNFIWGWVQDEQHRLTVARRAYEYDHHYGLNLLGKAVPPVRGADSRSRFLEAFHNLLFRCSIFFKEDDDTTVVADGFPILNALKEVHLLLTQGAHNQYGDLPWTARQEMLMQEWMLARPEMREFLPSRIMVDYPEPWMDRVETMKTLQGWTDTSILHFRDLGIFGEQVLLGIRFGAWPSVIEPQNAANWARYWRPEIQGYIHAYRAVTGVDLTERVDVTLPSMLLQQRLGPQRAMAAPQVVLTPMPSRLGQLPPRSTR